jgi:hypothetical protein
MCSASLLRPDCEDEIIGGGAKALFEIIGGGAEALFEVRMNVVWEIKLESSFLFCLLIFITAIFFLLLQ